jgi:hypothetical protein
MLLSKNQRFIKEHSEFSEKIARISNEQIKNDCTILLRDLSRYVQELDNKHIEFTSSRMPDHLVDIRENIQLIRKKLNSRLKDF